MIINLQGLITQISESAAGEAQGGGGEGTEMRYEHAPLATVTVTTVCCKHAIIQGKTIVKGF